MKEKIKHLEKELEAASMIDESLLSDEIRAVGFKCTGCARCCKSNHCIVAVFPFEIRKICEKTGKKAEDFFIPTPSADKDKDGNIHTFEWVIRNDGDCIFLKNSLCEIYECRPYICRTYPFYLLEGNLMLSECDGIGELISLEESRKLAVMLKERYITGIKESIMLFQKFRGFRPGGKGICVHDSEGEHWIKIEPGTKSGN